MVIESGVVWGMRVRPTILLAFYVAQFPGAHCIAASIVQIVVSLVCSCMGRPQAILSTSLVLLVACGRMLIQDARANVTVVTDMRLTSVQSRSGPWEDCGH